MERETLTILELEEKIYKMKKRMIESGIKKGLTHPETIKYSQELDVILNRTMGQVKAVI